MLVLEQSMVNSSPCKLFLNLKEDSGYLVSSYKVLLMAYRTNLIGQIFSCQRSGTKQYEKCKQGERILQVRNRFNMAEKIRSHLGSHDC